MMSLEGGQSRTVIISSIQLLFLLYRDNDNDSSDNDNDVASGFFL
jgi:hypothetical protein